MICTAQLSEMENPFTQQDAIHHHRKGETERKINKKILMSCLSFSIMGNPGKKISLPLFRRRKTQNTQTKK